MKKLIQIGLLLVATVLIGSCVQPLDSAPIGADAEAKAVTFNHERILNGYWHNFDNGSGFIQLRDVSAEWDVVNVSFAEPSANDGTMGFIPDPGFVTPAQFKADVQFLQSRGQKVIISIGGANGQVQLTTAGYATNFINTMTAIINEYGFDGMDIDFEGHSLSLEMGDDDFRNPTTPIIVNTINAINGVCNSFGPDFILTMAPETFFVQVGYSFYGGISPGADRRAGAYLPVIHAVRDRLTFLQVQNYNSGQIVGLDDKYHAMGSADFHVAMIDMLLTGFPICGDDTKFFPPLRQDQILVGLPANVNAGGGFTSVAEVHKALDALIKNKPISTYQLRTPGGYPNLRGLMTWSINWDAFNNFEFSTEHRAYFNTLEPVKTPTPTPTIDPNVTPSPTPTATPAPLYPEWQVNKAYALGDFVLHLNKIYECTYAHTSNSAWDPPSVPTLWKYLRDYDGTGPTPTPVVTSTPTNTPTPIVTPTNTPVVTPTNTPVVTPTVTPTATNTPEPTPTQGQGTYPAWSASAVYHGGDRVSHGGANWEAKWWTTGEEPGTTGQWGVWKSVQ